MKAALAVVAALLMGALPAFAVNTLAGIGDFENDAVIHTTGDVTQDDLLGVWHGSDGIGLLDDPWPFPPDPPTVNRSFDGTNHFLEYTSTWTRSISVWVQADGQANQPITVSFDAKVANDNYGGYAHLEGYDAPWTIQGSGQVWDGNQGYFNFQNATGTQLMEHHFGNTGGQWQNQSWTFTPDAGYSYYALYFWLQGPGTLTDTSTVLAIDNVVLDIGPAALHPGDANGDGKVSVGDLGILAANYGATGLDLATSWSKGDFNADGNVSVGDLGILAANYGWAGAVPEPMTLSILGLGVLGLIRRR